MTDSIFQPGQTYKTRGEGEAEIFAERNGFLFGRTDCSAMRWHQNGRWALNSESTFDLLPPPPPRIREMGWCNLWRDGSISFYRSQADAEYAAGAYCIRTAVLCMVDEIVDGEPGE